MRLLILGVSALSLSACSLGGTGFGFGQGGYGYKTQAAPAQHGVWSRSDAAAGYTQAGYGHVQGGGHAPVPCGFDPCAAPIAPAPYMPIAQPAPMPYPSGYVHQPVMPPAPEYIPPHIPAPVAGGCNIDPCAGGYSVSPYAYGTPQGHVADYGHGGYAPRPVSTPGHLYGTLGAVYFDTDNPGAGLQGRLGYQVNKWLGAELEGSFGLLDGKEDFTAVNGVTTPGEITDSVDWSVAAFAKAGVPISRTVSAHGRVGYHNTRTTREFDFDNGGTFSQSDTRVGLAYGAGLQYDVTPQDSVRLDATRYEGGDDLDTLSLAYLRRF